MSENIFPSFAILTTNVQGGLGNQLFIIFAALGTAISQNKIFKITKHDSTYPRGTYWDTLLSKLPTVEKIEERIDHNFEEKDYSIVEAIPVYKGNTSIKGFFQSSFYFSHISEKIREIIGLKKIDQMIVDKKIKKLREKWSGKDLIMIHVRRGDYLKHSDFHLNLPKEYYYKSLKHFDQDKSVFIIFSDDIEYCKNELFKDIHLNFDYISDVDYRELIMMSMMDGGIIANSSFSWWGAWLMDPKCEKKIVAPDRWLVKLENEMDLKYKIESHWIVEKTI
jgi:hypothetical protein